MAKKPRTTSGRTSCATVTATGETRAYRSARLDNRHTHGTGCTLASAIAAGLAARLPLHDAVARAEQFLQREMQRAYRAGRSGMQAMNPAAVRAATAVAGRSF